MSINCIAFRSIYQLYIPLIQKLKEMAQCFPQNMTQIPQGWFGYGPLPLKPSESATIDQLKRENDQLKRQLQSLMRPNPVQAKPIHNNQFMGQVIACRNSEDDAQRIYKDKLSKLKMKKSPRHSLQQNQTTPNSPRPNHQDWQRHTLNQTISHKVPHLILADPNSKMIVVSKDKYGKYFRQRDVQQRINTARKNNYSQQKMVAVHSTMNQGHIYNPSVMPPKQLVCPKMSVNQQVHKVNIFGKTQRKAVLTNHHQYSINELSKCGALSKQNREQGQPRNNKIQTSAYKYDSVHKQSHRDQQAHQKIIKNTTTQKRKVYVDQNIHQNQMGIRQWEQTMPIKSGDSQLSIERGLKQVNGQRKLKYNVYLEQDCPN